MSYNVLIVDDSEIIRAIIKKSIHMSGLDVGEIHEASNGLEGLQALSENWIDIVFADINMPEMDGLAMVDKMADDNLLVSVPVVIVSTERSQVQIDRLKERGIRAYIKKPFKPENFRETVLDVIGTFGGKNDGS